MEYILGLYKDNGKENGNYYNWVYKALGLGFRAWGLTPSP